MADSEVVWIDSNCYQTICCKVSPFCEKYGKKGFPVFSFYPDGSYAVLHDGQHAHSKAGYLKKPAVEFSVAELADIAHGRIVL